MAAAEVTRPAGEARVRWLIFVILFCSYAYFFQGGGWNPNSRLDLTQALVEQSTIRIDDYVDNTGDWSLYNDHYYTNKAPGLAILSTPIYWLVDTLVFDDDGAQTDVRLRTLGYACNIATNALPSALFGVLLFHELFSLGIPRTTIRAWGALAFGLGTLVFPYSTTYYAHQLAAAMSFTAFVCLLHAARGARTARRWAALGGLVGGLAVTCEWATAFTVLVLGGYCLLEPRTRRLAPWFILGGLPMAGALGLYNYLAFGNPIETGLTYTNPKVITWEGAIYSLPSFKSLTGLLVSPYRGLLFTSPLWVLAPFGWISLYRRDAAVAAVCLLVPLTFLIFVSGIAGWHGGWTPGPRYLIPCLPFLFVPVAHAMSRVPKTAAGLAGISVVIMLAITLVAIDVPDSFGNPLFDFVIPHLRAGHVSVNPQAMGAPFFDVGYVELRAPENWSSFNLGEFLFPHSPLSVLPLLGLWAVLGGGLLHTLRKINGPERSGLPLAAEVAPTAGPTVPSGRKHGERAEG